MGLNAFTRPIGGKHVLVCVGFVDRNADGDVAHPVDEYFPHQPLTKHLENGEWKDWQDDVAIAEAAEKVAIKDAGEIKLRELALANMTCPEATAWVAANLGTLPAKAQLAVEELAHAVISLRDIVVAAGLIKK